uniref:AB hydrolase-1 domain-containing protein n=1 Tax=Strombidinopsis acuminata TaxID=141414 RepID=A0A7S3U2T0_9SPIT|mmetsp:Transcript_6813/g.20719  ORF Transcript_6813/g.20719 Transcript_6813/m.20719 type:complete len:272 (-) Transcript_6813:259-1074(-)|eukprot:scaffold202928_cov30-Tisochrysis_lutea.AAC.2
MPSFLASDSVRLFYERKGTGPPVILIHGWSASHRSFDLNVEQIAARCTVIMPDLRFHGRSERPDWGFHVARLAADLRELILDTGVERPTCVGCSLGAAILWSYVELFGCDMLGRVCFVDQAPCQWMLPDWTCGSKGIYDETSLANITALLMTSISAFADGNATCCLTKPIPSSLLATLKSETESCIPVHLAKVMQDHAKLDWRPILPRITVPALNLYGTESGCFPIEGLAKVGELIPNARNEIFIGCNHWLYMEEPERFSKTICDFAHALS